MLKKSMQLMYVFNDSWVSKGLQKIIFYSMTLNNSSKLVFPCIALSIPSSRMSMRSHFRAVSMISWGLAPRRISVRISSEKFITS